MTLVFAGLTTKNGWILRENFAPPKSLESSLVINNCSPGFGIIQTAFEKAHYFGYSSLNRLVFVSAAYAYVKKMVSVTKFF